jgi:hypothetical protein
MLELDPRIIISAHKISTQQSASAMVDDVAVAI